MSESFIPQDFKKFKLALIQLFVNTEKSVNLTRSREFVLKAKAEGADIVVLPEIFNSPTVSTEYKKNAELIPCPTESNPISAEQLPSTSSTLLALSELAKEADVWIVGGSIPEYTSDSDKLYNCSTVFNRQGELVAKHRKIHLYDVQIPREGQEDFVFMESKSLGAGDKMTTFQTPFGKFGLAICYDVRFPELAMLAARQGACAMIYPSAFNTTSGPVAWELLNRARAIDNQIFVASCSPAQDDTASYPPYGHSLIVGPLGNVISSTDEKESIVYADIDPAVMEKTRRSIPVTKQRKPEIYGEIGL